MRVSAAAALLVLLGAALLMGRPYDSSIPLIAAAAAGFLVAGVVSGRWIATVFAFPWVLAMALLTDVSAIDRVGSGRCYTV